MLTFNELKKDLQATHECIQVALSKNDYKSAEPYSLKMSQLITWLMQNGYVED